MAKIFWLLLFVIVYSSCEDVAGEMEPSFDPEDRLIYSKNPKGYNELYKLENGVETVLISDPDYDYWWAKVHPDKTKILVYRSPSNPSKNHDAYEQADLVVADIDGQNIEAIIPHGSYDWRAQGVARWNNDGSQILMCAEVDIGTSFQWRLIRTNSEGSDPIVLSDRWALDCNFSNDNKHIYFMGFEGNQLSFDLTRLELQKGDYDATNGVVSNVRSLTMNNTRDHDPDISPNDSKLVFSAGNALYSNVDLVIYDLDDETETVILDDDSANGGSMCWSVDGTKVYFHSLKLLSSPFRIKCIDVTTMEVSTILKSDDNSFGFFHPESY